MTTSDPSTQVKRAYDTTLLQLENGIETLLWTAGNCRVESRLSEIATELRRKTSHYFEFTGGQRYKVSSDNKGLRRIYEFYVRNNISLD